MKKIIVFLFLYGYCHFGFSQDAVRVESDYSCSSNEIKISTLEQELLNIGKDSIKLSCSSNLFGKVDFYDEENLYEDELKFYRIANADSVVNGI